MADLEERLNLVWEDFVDTALYAVHFIVRQNTPGINLLNLMGEGGEKFMVGGLFVRRAKNWMVNGKRLSDDQPQIMKG